MVTSWGALCNSGPLTLTVNYASSVGYSVQRVPLFAGVSSARLNFHMHIDSVQIGSTAYDALQMQVITSTGNCIDLTTFSNKDSANSYRRHTSSRNAYKGRRCKSTSSARRRVLNKPRS